MTETRTPRFSLPQWSAGSDAPSRDDFNGAFADIETRGGFDAGDSAATLPVTNLVAGRSTQLTTASDGYTMYRYNGSAWQFTGGTLIPVAVKYRAQAQAVTAAAFTVEHPTRTTAALTTTYGGDVTSAGILRVFDADDDTRGVAVFGWNGTPVLGTHGRLHVRTRRTGDFGVVIQSHASDAGNLLTVREPGGQNVFTLDATGRFHQRTFSAFGGASIPVQSATAISPTSSDADTVTNGLLLYGQASAPAKSILRIQPDNTADLTPIMLVSRDGMTIGRLPWTGDMATGAVMLSANSMVLRASGTVGNPYYVQFRRSNPTSGATEADPSQDTGLISVGETGINAGLPLFVSQRYRQSSATMALYRVGNFGAPFLDLARLVPDGGGVEQSQLASTWASDGRLSTGAWWKGTGVVRDARQPVRHVSRKWFALPETGGEVGQPVDTGQTFTYTWSTMTVRSPSVTDLEVTLSIEFTQVPNPGFVDTNSFLMETLISINGAAYVVGDATHITLPLVQSASRPGGSTVTTSHRMAAVPAGASFILRTRITMGASIPDIRLRMFDIVVTEGLHESYTAP